MDMSPHRRLGISSLLICFTISAQAVVDGRVVGEKPKRQEPDAFERVYNRVTAPLQGPMVPKVIPPSKEMSNFDRYMLARTVQVGSLDQNGNFVAICTGVIRKNGEVATAGHCVTSSSGSRSKPINVRIAESNLAVQIYDPKTRKYRTVPVDSANLLHDQRMDFMNLKVNTGPYNYPEIRMATESCDQRRLYAAGFGVNEENDGVSERLRVAQFTQPRKSENFVKNVEYDGLDEFFRYGRRQRQEDIRLGGNARENSIVGVYDNDSRVCPGDSGGPIYCKVNGKFALAGITTTIRGRLDEPQMIEKRSYACRQYFWMSGISAKGILNVEKGIEERDARIQADKDRNIMERMYAGEEPPGVQ